MTIKQLEKALESGQVVGVCRWIWCWLPVWRCSMLTLKEVSEVLDPVLEGNLESCVAQNYHKNLILECANVIYTKAVQDLVDNGRLSALSASIFLEEKRNA